MPPNAETVKAAPKARPASPRLAMAWPSMMVAWEPTVPGTANSTEGMVSEVVVTASMPMMKAKAETASMSKVKGSSKRQPGDPADAGDDTEHEAEEGPGEQHEQVHRIDDVEAGLAYGVKHEGVRVRRWRRGRGRCAPPFDFARQTSLRSGRTVE